MNELAERSYQKPPRPECLHEFREKLEGTAVFCCVLKVFKINKDDMFKNQFKFSLKIHYFNFRL